MQRTRNRSASNHALNFDQLPVKRILAVSLLCYLLVVIELFLLTSYRVSALPSAAAVLCGDAADVYAACVNELIKIMLYNGQWSAVKFSIYVFTLTPITYLLMRKNKGSNTGAMLVLTIILLLAIAGTLKPPWVELVAALFSSILAGLLIKRRQDKSKAN